MKDKLYLYAAREIETGKLVSDITNPRRKYWERKDSAVKAINNYYDHGRRYSRNRGNHGNLELVTFELVEVKNQ